MSTSAIPAQAPHTLPRVPSQRLSARVWKALTPSAAGPPRGRGLEALRRAMESRSDSRRLRERLPELFEPLRAREAWRASLLPLYRRFVAHVAPPASAMSLEVAGFLLELCERTRPRRIVEVGTGFGSATLRRAAKAPEWEPEIWSADLDPARLARTRAFLAEESIATDRLLSWRELSGSAEAGFDLAIHDMVTDDGAPLVQILERVLPGGLVLLDGARRPAPERAARRLLAEAGAEAFSLRALTRDCFGRHALLAVR